MNLITFSSIHIQNDTCNAQGKRAIGMAYSAEGNEQIRICWSYNQLMVRNVRKSTQQMGPVLNRNDPYQQTWWIFGDLSCSACIDGLVLGTTMDLPICQAHDHIHEPRTCQQLEMHQVAIPLPCLPDNRPHMQGCQSSLVCNTKWELKHYDRALYYVDGTWHKKKRHFILVYWRNQACVAGANSNECIWWLVYHLQTLNNASTSSPLNQMTHFSLAGWSYVIGLFIVSYFYTFRTEIHCQ